VLTLFLSLSQPKLLTDAFGPLPPTSLSTTTTLYMYVFSCVDLKQLSRLARSSIMAAVAAAACCCRLNSSRSTRVKAEGVAAAARLASKGRKMLLEECEEEQEEEEASPTPGLEDCLEASPKRSLKMLEMEKASDGFDDCFDC